MSVTWNDTGAIRRIQLDGDIDISSAAELKTAFVQALESGHEIEVSLAGATQMDVTAVQLLWAAVRDAGQQELEFRMTAIPEEVSRMFDEAGLNCLNAQPAVEETSRFQ